MMSIGQISTTYYSMQCIKVLCKYIFVLMYKFLVDKDCEGLYHVHMIILVPFLDTQNHC